MEAAWRTPAGQALRRFLDVLADPKGLAEDAYAEWVGPTFASALPYPAFQDFVAGLSGSWTPESIMGDDARVVAVARNDVRRARFEIGVTASDPPTLTGLLVKPLAEPGAGPTGPADRGLPDTLAADALCWYLDLLDGRRTTDPSDFEERFTDSFVASVGFDQLETIVGQLAGVYTVERYTETDGAPGIVAVVSSSSLGAALEVSLVRSPEPPHRIASLLQRPTTLEPVEVASFAELEAHLEGLDHEAAWLIAEVEGGSWQQVAGGNAHQLMPLGSIFKLYVLGAVADAVEDGSVSWDDPVVVRDLLRNEPTRGMGGMAAGEHVTVKEAARLMISISCNTATDHLIDLVGRDAVEAALPRLGHHDPSATVPFLSSREMFLLKWGVPSEQRDAYIAAGPDHRRQILDGLGATPLSMPDLRFDGRPTAIEALEWFATPADVCTAMVSLVGLGEPVREVLATNPGLLRSAVRTWSYVGFKGGSEPGVLTGCWYLEADDGPGHVIVLMLRDTERPIAPATLLGTIEATLPLLHT